MLAIFLGLAAWVLDAVISWQYFPGRTFFDMIWGYDPWRTLYVRSTVVGLFFLFGLCTGLMLERQERQKVLDRQNIRLLQGIRDIQGCTFTANDPEEMSESTVGLIREMFGFRDVYLVRVEPGTRSVLSRHTTQGLNLDLVEFRSLEDQLSLSTGAAVSPRPESCARATESGRENGLQAPLSFNGVLYGAVLGVWPGEGGPDTSTLLQEQFLTVCNHIGQAVAHFHNLQKSERTTQRVKRLYDLSPMGVFVTTISGRAEYFNPALRRMLTGSAAADSTVLEQPVASWYVDPVKRAEFLLSLQRAGQVNDFEFQLRRRDGNIRTVLMAARLNREIEPADPHVEGFVLDITHRRAAEESNRQLQQELQKAKHCQAITVLAGGVAHEFNNILQAMMGSAYLGQLKVLPEQEELGKYLRDIQESGRRAARLCDQMLSYAGKRAMMLKLEVADDCLRRVLNMLRTEVPPEAVLREGLGAPGVRAHLDEPSLSEVVNNLVLNAVESLENREDGRVEILTELQTDIDLDGAGFHMIRPVVPDSYWVLSVRDNGPGIPAEDLPHIFEPFFTTKFQGRGLGLSAVSGIVEKFDGNLGVRSDQHRGTEFVLCLPIAEEVEVAPEEEPVKEKPHVGGGRIWVLDDEPLIGETVKRMLTRGGYDVQTAQDPLAFLKIFTPDEISETQCVILDVTMPRLNGLDVLKQIRVLAPDLPVLMMSGYDESEQSATFEDLHISGFIHKPFLMDQLVRKLDGILG